MARRRDEWVEGGPRPGDPASSGPRPRPTWRDRAWFALTVALVAVTLAQTVRLLVTILADDRIVVGGFGAFLGFVITAVWFLIIFWLSLGAWRRSVWGCPFEHTESTVWARRCQRHALVGDPEPTAAELLERPGTPP